MSRISERFRAARAERRGALIPYVTAGYPSLERTIEIAVALHDAGADVLELGVPFSDPVADGPVIQRASEAALAGGATLERCLDAAGEIAARVELPIVLFGYYNPFLQFGLARLGRRLAEVGVDGLLVTDVVPEESSPLLDALAPHRVETIFLAAPTSSDERLAKIAGVASGFVYAVSRTGVTGARDEMSKSARELVSRLRTVTDLPVAVGFGVSNAEQVADVWSYADGAVVGSRLVAEIAASPDDDDLARGVSELLGALAPAGESW
jgi:tryptophan synthase alpha chain